MVGLNIAYTQSINPPDASPILTRAQVWKGLEIKIRHAERFVPFIEGTDVVEDNGDEVVRIAHFGGVGGKPATSRREVCNSFEPVKVDFHEPDGTIITNTISDGPGMDDADLKMTYTFEWRLPDLQEGSEEHKRVADDMKKDAKTAVEFSIEAMREMAKKGEI